MVLALLIVIALAILFPNLMRALVILALLMVLALACNFA